MNESEKVVAYIRRSTDLQPQSLQRQKSDVQRYAAENGLTIQRWYEDDSISGTATANRNGFLQLVDDAEKKRDFNLILVAEWSRFARLGVYETGIWIDRLRRVGVKIRAISGSIRDPYSREGKLLLAMETDREESIRISQRTLSGQRETATKGLRAGGKCPFGYTRRRRKADGTVEIVGRVGRAKRDKAEVIELIPGDPVEVEAVQAMFRMARDGVGYRTIAEHLSDRGLPSPDMSRRKTIATVSGRWTATTVRALLMNPVFCGDVIWNVRSMPKFHRLENDKIVALDDFEQNRYRRNSKADWVVKRDAHPALIDRALFEAVQSKIQTHASKPRGHTEEYLLSGSIVCANCGDKLLGTRRTRRKMVNGQMKLYADLLYVCAGTLRQKGRCRQVSIPRDGFERAVLRVLDEEIFSSEALARLEHHLRLEVDRRRAGDASDGIAAMERRALDLQNRIAEGARRILQVGDDLVSEVRTAINELMEDLQRVRAAIDAKRRSATLAADGEDLVRRTIDGFKSMASVLRDPTFPLERRKEVLRRLLPLRDGILPIRVEVDVNAKRGWRNALRRVTVRHLTFRNEVCQANVVAGAGFEPATSGL